ncbi:MAG TPA: carboxypeptidase-like regulatory domain-containing protein [Dongiaceae bacterium]|nr:carboxypeptidase-like regulatory domain-containing protein [Dongiaceae bacterium]
MKRLSARRAAGAALLTAWSALAPAAWAADKAKDTDAARTPAPAGLGTIRGIIYRGDDTTRVMGATVTAINVNTGRRYTSNYTGENGAYEVTGIPAGTYDIAIDSGDKVYVSDSLVDLAESQKLYLSYSVSGGEPTGADTPVFKGGAKLTFTDPNAVPAVAPGGKKSFWKRPGGIAIISVLVAGVTAAGVSAQQGD